MQHIVIVGNGIAGVTTARHIRKRSDDKITIVSGETDHFYSTYMFGTKSHELADGIGQRALPYGTLTCSCQE